MKRQLNTTLWLASVLTLFSSNVVWGFYDPNLQRWISRDPLGEPGFEAVRSQRPSVLRAGPNRYLFVLNTPVSRSDPLGLDRNHNGPPSSDYIFPKPPAANPCAGVFQSEFKSCMQSFSEGLCLKDAYKNLHGGMQAAEWSLASSDTGPLEKAAAYGLAWELRLSTVLLGTLYGGGAVGCAAKAAGAYNACLVDNM